MFCWWCFSPSVNTNLMVTSQLQVFNEIAKNILQRLLKSLDTELLLARDHTLTPAGKNKAAY